MNNPYKYRVSVVKEELYALTCDALGARILNQFLYWSERTNDYDKFIREEIARSANDGTEVDFPLTNGWIYKKVGELREEIMADESDTTVRRRLQQLVDIGWLDERTNPIHKWDKTLQYRPNLLKICFDLSILGLSLTGYHFESSNLHGEDSRIRGEGAIPEITVKNTNKKKRTSPANGAGEQEAFDLSDIAPVIEVVVVGEEEYVPSADPPKKPRKRTVRDDVFDAIMELWGVGEGECVRMMNQMMGTVPQKDREYRCRFDKPVTPDEVRKFVTWYKQHNEGGILPKNAGKLQTHFGTFRKGTEQEVKLAAEGKKFIPGVGYVKTY